MKNLSFVGYDKYCITEDGRVYSIRSRKFIVLGTKTNSTYKKIMLNQNGVKKTFLVHRLVAMAYIPNPENKPTVNHKDGVKDNNHVSNLEWATHQEQSDHYKMMGLRPFTRDPKRLLTDEEAHEVCQLICQGWRFKDIATAFDIEPSIVSQIFTRHSYRDISIEYDFSSVPSRNMRIKPEKVIEICEDLQEKKLTPVQIANKHSVQPQVVWKIKRRKTYTDLTSSYNF